MQRESSERAGLRLFQRAAAALAFAVALFGPILLPLHLYGPGGHAALAHAADAPSAAAFGTHGDAPDESICHACPLLHATQSALQAAPVAGPVQGVLLRAGIAVSDAPAASSPLRADLARAPPISA